MNQSIPILRTKSLSKSYRKIPALQDIDLVVEKGDIYGIIGQSGAGKSTLLRCLAGLINPTSGNVFFDQQNILEMNEKTLRHFHLQIGMIFQHFNLLSSRSVAQNIAYPMEIAKKKLAEQNAKIDELLSLVHLTHKKEMHPASLSGGEKQRVGIARALANAPQILFCDEATSALDPKTTKEILQLLKTIHKKFNITIVLITHDMEVIKAICNKVAVLERGKIVEQGLVTEVFSDPQHPITKNFIQNSLHEIPTEFFKTHSPNRKLLKLRFKGQAAGEPIIAQIVKEFHVEANILLGWIDRLQTITVGTLIIELSGEHEGIAQTLVYLNERSVHYEVLERG
jgi:D-methionine transport system ATP-binding protein